MPDELAEIRADALDTCRDILEWRTTGEQWETIEKLVGVLGQAVLAGDWSSVRSATAELELNGPNRIKLAGEKEPPKEPAPPLRERVAETIIELEKQQPPPAK